MVLNSSGDEHDFFRWSRKIYVGLFSAIFYKIYILYVKSGTFVDSHFFRYGI